MLSTQRKGRFLLAASLIGLVVFFALSGMTQLVAPDQQGQLQGATASVQSVAQLAGPFLFTLTFAYFIGQQSPVHLPGAPFLLASLLLVLALGIAAWTLAWARKG